MKLLPITLLLIGCGGDGPTYGGSGSASAPPPTGDSGTGADSADSAAPEPVWELMVDRSPYGFLTGAWTHGEEVLVAGGQINGGDYGFLTHIRPDEVCVEEPVGEEALWWVHGASDERYFAVGEGGAILLNEGGEWRDESTGEGGILYGMFDAGERTWAVQGNGTIWSRDEGGWSKYAEGLSRLFKVWCDGPDRCVFVGENRIYQLEDGALAEHEIEGQIWTCRGRSWSDIWCVGGVSGAVVYHYDGEAWEDVDTTGLSVPVFGVWTAEGEDVWIGGARGLMGRYVDGEWLVEPALTDEEFHGVWKEGDDVYFVGGNLNPDENGEYHGNIVHYGPPRGALELGPCD